MLVPLFILVVLRVQTLVEAETIDVAVGAGCHNLSVVLGNNNILDMVRKGEQMQCFVVDGVINENVLLFVDG